MTKRGGGIKVISNGPCPIEAIEGFNRRIAEILAMKFPKETIEKIIAEYERNKDKIS